MSSLYVLGCSGVAHLLGMAGVRLLLLLLLDGHLADAKQVLLSWKNTSFDMRMCIEVVVMSSLYGFNMTTLEEYRFTNKPLERQKVGDVGSLSQLSLWLCPNLG
jgi:hypothetical protein